MTDLWSERAEAYRDSDAHREGRDLELFAEWAEGDTALDVATGGGNVARILREAGLAVVTIDSAPGMQPTVVSRAEEIPFAASSFDVVACRVAAHHFEDPALALKEMARVSRSLVLVSDNLFVGEAGEEADRLRDPTHVRNYSKEEWRGMFDQAGLEVEAYELEDKRIDFEAWLDRSGTPGEDRPRIAELLADRVEDGKLRLERAIFKGRKR
ncbi:MAG TPA: methyltransferase domain-containing protein [Gaiellaceae bacterium]|nr:methyltransferase domain-containing protein [Gaiellaceae bacterium]